MRVLAVFNMLRQDQESIFSLIGADGHYRVHHRLSELDVAIFLEAVSQELKKCAGLGWDTLIK